MLQHVSECLFFLTVVPQPVGTQLACLPPVDKHVDCAGPEGSSPGGWCWEALEPYETGPVGGVYVTGIAFERGCGVPHFLLSMR